MDEAQQYRREAERFREQQAEQIRQYRFGRQIDRLIEAELAAQEKIPIRNRKPAIDAAESAPTKPRRSATPKDENR